MASGPMQQCCVSGVLHQGTPQGKVQTISDNIQTYIATPTNPTHNTAIILLTDAYGYTFPNARLVADQFAANGHLTLIPDLFDGAQVPFPPPADFNLQTYIDTQMPRIGTVDPICEKVVKYLRDEAGIAKIGGAGYCFGGKYVCRWLREGGLDAGYVAHPSFVDAEEVAGVQGPLSIAAAQVDDIFTTEKRRETEDMLSKKTNTWQIFLYSDTEHGFAMKGHMSTQKARFAKEQAFAQAVAWFEEHLKNS